MSRVLRARKAALSLTQRATERLSSLLTHQEKPVSGIRLGIKTRGCNGLAYTLNYVSPDKIPATDEVVESGGGAVKVFIDPKAMLYVVGTEMDFVENDVKSEFVFNNPNAKGQCGCGESFNI